MPTNNAWNSQNPAQVALGGTGLATITSHGILLGNGTGNITPTAEPSDGQLLIGKTGDFPQLATLTAGSGISITNAAGSITIAGAAGGTVIQCQYTSSVAKTQCTTVMNFDDTIPQNTEGDQVLTLSITPKSATNTLLIDFVAPACVIGNNANSIWAMCALFQDATANALNGSWGVYGSVATTGSIGFLHLRHWMVAGTTSATTFKVRVGPNSGVSNEVCINGYNNARIFGGVAMASLTITEFTV